MLLVFRAATPFKAWVAGSNSAALTIHFNKFEIGTFQSLSPTANAP